MLPFNSITYPTLSLSWAALWEIFINEAHEMIFTKEVANILLKFMPDIIKTSLTSKQMLDGESNPAIDEYFTYLKQQV